MKYSIFIRPAIISKWWHALQRGESTAEKVAAFFANNEPREAWRILFKAYATILKRSRHESMKSDLDEYTALHDVLARMLLKDIRRHYTDAVFGIVKRYYMFYKYDVEEVVATISKEDEYEYEEEEVGI